MGLRRARPRACPAPGSSPSRGIRNIPSGNTPSSAIRKDNIPTSNTPAAISRTGRLSAARAGRRCPVAVFASAARKLRGYRPARIRALQPGQRQPRGAPLPADTSPQPGDEVITEPPSQKIANTGALFSGLDKITGRIINFDVAMGETVQFGALQVTPRICYTRPPTETANTDAFIEVDEVTLQGDVKRVFTGWMFAASPGLHAVEHPIYDVWLTDCKNPPVVAVTAPEPPPVAQPAKPPGAGEPAAAATAAARKESLPRAVSLPAPLAP